MSDDIYRRVLIGLATARPNMRASTLVALADAVYAATYTPSLDDAQALATWALGIPEVAAAVAQDKKINAIKELRVACGSSLAQAKNAIDLIPPYRWGAA